MPGQGRPADNRLQRSRSPYGAPRLPGGSGVNVKGRGVESRGEGGKVNLHQTFTSADCIGMYECMRTTLVLDDSVFERAKKKSSELGMTLSELTTTALRNFLFSKERSNQEKMTFKMMTFGTDQRMHQTPEELAKLRDEGR